MVMTAEQEKPPAHPMVPTAVPPRPVPAQGETPASPGTAAPALTTRNLSVFFGANHVLKRVSLDIPACAVSAIIGPSGCGKSTFLRALNRMHELVPTARIEGEIRLFGQDIYGNEVQPVVVRRRVGMVFQK